MTAFAEAIGRPQANIWLKDSGLDRVDGEWILFAPTRFSAHWTATRFDQELRHPATVAGLPNTPAGPVSVPGSGGDSARHGLRWRCGRRWSSALSAKVELRDFNNDREGIR